MNKTLVCLHWHFVIDFLYKHLQPPPPLPPSISCLLEASAVKCQLISSIGSLIDMRPAIGCWSIHELVDYWQSVDQVSVDQVLIKMLIECWLSINWDIDWVSIDCWSRVDWRLIDGINQHSTMDAFCSYDLCILNSYSVINGLRKLKSHNLKTYPWKFVQAWCHFH